MTGTLTYTYAVAQDADGTLTEALSELSGVWMRQCIWCVQGKAAMWWSP
ncbi:hypothetical protein ACFCZY_41850 [Streptomyces sp. NPDC056237]